ncbi:MAG: peptidoglycan DD-metalloendopeptidase family protein [Rhodobacterales bacterium]|jgi:lipoprotein NlpD|nr:peptidoglycan DD-metalloendopeptidase family protein [Rhodobacter sp.]HBN31918.1 peptidase M23 [Paracoccaceae bacterium]
MRSSSFNPKGAGVTAGILALFLLAGCDAGIDLGNFNLRGDSQPLQTVARPTPDARGVISYPNYQVVVARKGETVATIATRIGLSGAELAQHNGLPQDYAPREGELLALPRRVSEGSGTFDIASIASTAIDKAENSKPKTTSKPATGVEPIRHRVERGETAYSIARLYDVSVTALASWNGLGPDLAVREGQHLLIPVVDEVKPTTDDSKPGKGSTTPIPPSASKPLPDTVKTEKLPASPKLGELKTIEPVDRKFLVPVVGKIIADFSGKSGGNEGIDIGVIAGTTVKAAEDGEVALVSKSVGSKFIVLLRHADNIYTVYSNVAEVKLTKGDKVTRGQPLGVVADGTPPYLHFEVRKGTQSVDPKPFL